MVEQKSTREEKKETKKAWGMFRGDNGKKRYKVRNNAMREVVKSKGRKPMKNDMQNGKPKEKKSCTGWQSREKEQGCSTI